VFMASDARRPNMPFGRRQGGATHRSFHNHGNVNIGEKPLQKKTFTKASVSAFTVS